jgi:hypothetical protein
MLWMIFFEKKVKSYFSLRNSSVQDSRGQGAPEEETVAELGAVQCSKKQNRSFYIYF